MEMTVCGEQFHYYKKSQTDKKGIVRTYLRASVLVSANPAKKVEVTAQNEDRLRNKIIDLQRARHIEDASFTTFSQYIESWLCANRLRLKESTYESYRYSLSHYVCPIIGEIRMSELTESDITEMLASIISSHGLSVASHMRIMLGRPLTEAVEKHLTYGNVIKNVKVMEPQKKEMLPLSPEECRNLLSLCMEEKTYGGPIAISLLAGMRISECIGLSTQDIDLDKRLIHIKRQIIRISGRSIIQNTTKNNKERIVYMNDITLFFIKREMQLLEQKKSAAGSKWNNQYNSLFTDKKGNFIRHQALRKHFHSLADKINRPGIRFHLLRHTAATILHEETNNIFEVKTFLGHKRYDSTGIYIHSSPEMLEHTAKAIASYLSKAQ